MNVSARAIEGADIGLLHACFIDTVWERDLEFFEGLLAEHSAGIRHVLVGTVAAEPVGFASILWSSRYPPFREEGVAELSDLNVEPRSRRRGVASCIIQAAEETAARRGVPIGIGVGLHSGYGAAQQLYVRLGYVPDGRGVSYHGRFPEEGESLPLDDDLVLYFRKVRDSTYTPSPRTESGAAE